MVHVVSPNIQGNGTVFLSTDTAPPLTTFTSYLSRFPQHQQNRKITEYACGLLSSSICIPYVQQLIDQIPVCHSIREQFQRLPGHLRIDIQGNLWTLTNTHVDNSSAERPLEGDSTDDESEMAQVYDEFANLSAFSKALTEVTKKIEDFDPQPFFAFHQDMNRIPVPAPIRNAFASLPPSFRHQVYAQIWTLSGRPSGDPRYGEHHVFANLLLFQKALDIVAARETSFSMASFMDQLSSSQGTSFPPEVRRQFSLLPLWFQNEVYEQVAVLSGRTLEKTKFGKDHVFDNTFLFYRAVDAALLERLKEEMQPLEDLQRSIFEVRVPIDTQEKFNLLPAEFRHHVYYQIWMLAGRPEGDPHYGEHHVFDRAVHFCAATKQSLQTCGTASLLHQFVTRNEAIKAERAKRRAELKSKLDTWVDDNSRGDTREQRLDAKRAMLRCFDRQDTKLLLASFELCSFPPGLEYLPQIVTLIASENHFTTLPPEIGCLKKLNKLDVSDNRLRVLPKELGQLHDLKWLNISKNHLWKLPPEMRNLTALEYLNITKNQIRRLPPGLTQNFPAIRRLLMAHNRFRELDRSFLQICDQTQIDVSYNPFSPGEVAAYNQELAEHRKSHPGEGPSLIWEYGSPSLPHYESLEEAITEWLIFKETSDLAQSDHGIPWAEMSAQKEHLQTNPFYAPLLTLPEEDQSTIQTFLEKLKGTEDFYNPSTEKLIILQTLQMVAAACKYPAFKQKMMELMGHALDTCHDRVTIYFDQIHLQRQFLCDSLNDQQLAQLILGAARLDLLDKEAQEIITKKGHGEDIETLLYFRIRLKTSLSLPVSVEGMLYPDVAGVDTEELATVQQRVLEKTSSPEQQIEILYKSDLWQDKLRNELTTITALHAKLSDEISAIMDDETLPSDQQMEQIAQKEKEFKDQSQEIIYLYTKEWVEKSLKRPPAEAMRRLPAEAAGA